MKLLALTIRHSCAVACLLCLANCASGRTGELQSSPQGFGPADSTVPEANYGPLTWKAVLVAGDSSIGVFDNGVEQFAGLLDSGSQSMEIRRLTSDRARSSAGLSVATTAEIDKAFGELAPRSGDVCLLFVTSHGGNGGMLLERDSSSGRSLSAGEMKSVLDRHCSELPTVAVMSSCFSGQFISPATITPNRIILTAARADRPSFGCSSGATYTYFDGCLFESWPRSHTWQELAANTSACVAAKENELDKKPSEPQAFFGRRMKGLPLP